MLPVVAICTAIVVEDNMGNLVLFLGHILNINRGDFHHLHAIFKLFRALDWLRDVLCLSFVLRGTEICLSDCRGQFSGFSDL
jgi:hypothetical protein